jgi:hypothetical protein
MNFDELRKDKAVNKLFVLINPAESTKTGYITALKDYTVFKGMSPTKMATCKNGKATYMRKEAY